MKRTGMVLQTSLEGLGLGGVAGACLRCGHLQRGCWGVHLYSPAGMAVIAMVLAAMMTIFTH